MDQIEQFADAVFQSVKRYVDAVTKRIGDESAKVMAGLEQRLAALQEAIANIPAGEKGADGERGEKGEPGASVTIDDVAPLIAEQVNAHVAALPPAENGKDGTDGRDGRDGKQGPPGRDALEIDVLPKIDPQRQYPRGTFASWDGGVIRAVRLTDPVGDDGIEVAGWAVVVRGLADLTLDQGEDLRTICVTCRMTAGAPVRREFTLPALIDRGVYRADADYVRGDGVTYGGSFWIAQKATQDKPGTSDSWRLAVKRGADGRDGDASTPTPPRKVSLR